MTRSGSWPPAEPRIRTYSAVWKIPTSRARTGAGPITRPSIARRTLKGRVLADPALRCSGGRSTRQGVTTVTCVPQFASSVRGAFGMYSTAIQRLPASSAVAAW